MINFHHKEKLKNIVNPENNDVEAASYQHSYIINCVTTFIYRAFIKRKKFLKDKKEREDRLNTIIINFAPINIKSDKHAPAPEHLS